MYHAITNLMFSGGDASALECGIEIETEWKELGCRPVDQLESTIPQFPVFLRGKRRMSSA